MAKWIRRRFPEPKIVGSSPIWDVLPGCCICFFVRGAGTASTVVGACSVMVIIGASQALDPGSIPGRRIAAFWGISSIGRVRALQARGTGIETPMLHSFSLSIDFIFCSLRAVLLAVNISSGSSVGRAWV